MTRDQGALVQAHISHELRERLRIAVELEGTTTKAVIAELLEAWLSERSEEIEAEAVRRLRLITDAAGGASDEGAE